MRITHFKVQGYKNFREEIKVEFTDSITVFHGANNVGKSNLLQSIQVHLAILQESCRTTEFKKRFEGLALNLPLKWRNLFTLGSPAPILMELGVEFSDKEMESFSGPRRTTFSTRIDKPSKVAIESTAGEGLEAVLLAMGISKLKPVFDIIGVDRTLFTNSEANERGLIPSTIVGDLYDGRDSLIRREAERWTLFEDVCGRFEDMLGGRVGVIFPRKTENKPILIIETPEGRIPAQLLGSGAQQILGLLGRLLTTDASVVAIEEPELNLRVATQERLAEALQFIVEDGRGPTQILITSHSPVFERGGDFFLVRKTHTDERSTVVVERRTSADVHRVTGALTYISTDGILRFSPIALEHLGLPHGGSVSVEPDEALGELHVFSDKRWEALHPIRADDA